MAALFQVDSNYGCCHEEVTIREKRFVNGLFSTVHTYTKTWSLTDQPMRDRRDSWAAAENIIPASSRAAKALQFIWKDLKIMGKAYRVPTKTGSIAELNLITERSVAVQEGNLVSADFTGCTSMKVGSKS